MAVAVDSNSHVTNDADGVTTLSLTTFTVGSGANRALVVFLGWDKATTVTSGYPRWDDAGTPQAMEAITNAVGNNTVRSQIYGLVAPTSGNKTLKVNWTTSAELIISIVSFTGVNQTGGTTTFPNGTSGTGSGANPSIAVTSAVGRYTAAMVTALNTQTGQTQTLVANVIGVGNANDTATIAVGASSVTHGYTAVAATWAAAGTDIREPNANPVGPFPTSRPDLP